MSRKYQDLGNYSTRHQRRIIALLNAESSNSSDNNDNSDDSDLDPVSKTNLCTNYKHNSKYLII